MKLTRLARSSVDTVETRQDVRLRAAHGKVPRGERAGLCLTGYSR
jgi:hypothetical protein